VFAVPFIWYSRNTGQPWWIYWAPFMMAGAALALGIPVYRAQRSLMTEPQPLGPVD
jgi:APA family basic amino acid/polyamine antiporter